MTASKQTKGRPRLPLSDVIFSAVMKVYSMSGRRAMGELQCTRRGKLDKAPVSLPGESTLDSDLQVLGGREPVAGD